MSAVRVCAISDAACSRGCGMGQCLNEKTGWPPGLLQDDDRGLSRWLASKPDARLHAREAVTDAEAYLRGKYGAYRGHFAWRELEEAFNAGAASLPRVMTPLTDAQIQPLFRQVQREAAQLEKEGRYAFGGWLPVAVRLIEAAHGIGTPTKGVDHG